MLNYILTKGYLFIGRGVFISTLRFVCYTITLKLSADELLVYIKYLGAVSLFIIVNGGILQNYLITRKGTVTNNILLNVWKIKLHINWVTLIAGASVAVYLNEFQVIQLLLTIALINLSPPIISYAPILDHDRWYISAEIFQVVIYFGALLTLLFFDKLTPLNILWCLILSLLIKSLIELFYYFLIARKVLPRAIEHSGSIMQYLKNMLFLSLIDWFEQRGFLLVFSPILAAETQLIFAYGERLRVGFSAFNKVFRPFFLYLFNTKHEKRMKFLNFGLLSTGVFAFTAIYLVMVRFTSLPTRFNSDLLLFICYSFIPMNVALYAKLTRYDELSRILYLRLLSLVIACVALVACMIAKFEVGEILSLASVPFLVQFVDRVSNRRRN